MKKNILCLIIILAAISSCKTGNKKDKPVKNEQVERFYVEFLAYQKDKPQGSPGHIFVEFWRQQHGSNISYGKFGFGPDNGYTIEMFKNGVEWKGKFGKEAVNTPIDISFKREVSKELFEKALNVKNSWMNSSTFYKGNERDCITFALEVAKAINLNNSRCICFPYTQVEMLRDDNP